MLPPWVTLVAPAPDGSAGGCGLIYSACDGAGGPLISAYHPGGAAARLWLPDGPGVLTPPPTAADGGTAQAGAAPS